MPEQTIEALVLSSQALGEQDRLLAVLSGEQGLMRLAAPGARRPRSSLAAAVPLAHLRLQIGGNRGLRRLRQLQVLHHYGTLGTRLETLAAAQALCELALALVADDDPAHALLNHLLLQLGRLEQLVEEKGPSLEVLAVLVQGSLQQLALGVCPAAADLCPQRCTPGAAHRRLGLALQPAQQRRPGDRQRRRGPGVAQPLGAGPAAAPAAAPPAAPQQR